MLHTIPNATMIENRWDEARASGMSEPELLLYRSNLLGADKRVTNYGGGNTSAKVIETDPLTRLEVEVLWVKGSGGDLGSMVLDGFATLYLDKLNAMKGIYRGVDQEDEMVGLLPHATFNVNPRAASIDTPLHAFVPRRHVDHTHPDAVIAIAATRNSRELTKRIYGDEIGWLPWKRPGFELGLWLENFARENPNAKGCVLGSHGLFTWADDARTCYELTLDIINRAIRWFERETAGKPVFGGRAFEPLPAERRKEIAAHLMPEIRGRIGAGEAKGRPFRRFPGGAGIRLVQPPRRARRHGHVVPGPFPAHQDPPAGARLRSAPRAIRIAAALPLLSRDGRGRVRAKLGAG
jgi:rhamnose utilization protein RhaD (predicted bifunctional aldolase and dehydrogenase)